MKRLFAFVLALAMAMSLMACGGDKSTSAGETSGDSANKVVKIGVFEPQTGDNGGGGKKEILGMQYANYV